MDQDFFVCVAGNHVVGKALTQLKFDVLMFTGGTSIGKMIAVEAAKNLIPCILELGGKSPVVVDKTADLDYAAMKICFGRFMNCGQICIAPDYVLV